MREDDDDDKGGYCAAPRSRRIRPWLRLWPPAKKNSGASSRDSRYPESLAAASMLTGARLGTEAFSKRHSFHDDIDFESVSHFKKGKYVQNGIVHHLF